MFCQLVLFITLLCALQYSTIILFLCLANNIINTISKILCVSKLLFLFLVEASQLNGLKIEYMLKIYKIIGT